MNFPEIDQILLTKSLAANPAFDDLNILIEPIPCTNGCPLGLYFPVQEWSPIIQGVMPEHTIVLPPDALEGALFHELGHRHGHYYYDDLSEKYAENFRKQYQKGRALLYLGNDFNILPRFGALFEEGEGGAVEMAFLQPLTQNELYGIESRLHAVGYEGFQCECIGCGYVLESEKHCISLTCPRCGGQMRRLERPGPGQPRLYHGNSEVPWVRVEFTKGVDWMVIIGSILAGATVAGIGAIGYAVYKTAETTPWVVPIALAGAGALLLLRAAMREEKVKARIPI